MKSITWYINRFKKMNVLEVFHRIRIFLYEKKLEFTFGNMNSVNVDYIKNMNLYFKNSSENIVFSADRFINEHYLLFNKYLKVYTKKEDKYLVDYIDNKKTKNMFFNKINLEKINPKHIWEFNKCYQFLSLAISYKKTKNKIYFNKLLEEFKRWIEQNSNYNSVNWCSNLEMSIRNINWILALELIIDGIDAKDKFLILNTIVKQVNFVFNRLSLYSSSNNHLIGELTFLLIASKKIGFKNNDKIYKYSKRKLEEQIEKQFYKDGINKEQSINYQVHTTELYLICIKFLDDINEKFDEKVYEIINKSLNYLRDISEIDGNFINIGDQDSGNIIKFSERSKEILDLLHWGYYIFYDEKLILNKENYISDKVYFFYGDKYIDLLMKQEYKDFIIDENYDSGGMIIKERLIKNKKIKLVFDYGEIGMKPLYAHAHSDILSLNFSINGKPVFTDMGTYKYKLESGWRDYFRGIYAHNSIAVNEKNQFNFLGAFICDKSPNSKLVYYNKDGFSAITNAYIEEKCILSREVIYINSGFEINDKIQILDNKEKCIDIIFNFDNDVKIKTIENNTLLLSIDNVLMRFYLDNKLKIKIYNGYNDEIIRGYESKDFNDINETNQIIARVYSNMDIVLKHVLEVI